jgi:hypothetical protein
MSPVAPDGTVYADRIGLGGTRIGLTFDPRTRPDQGSAAVILPQSGTSVTRPTWLSLSEMGRYVSVTVVLPADDATTTKSRRAVAARRSTVPYPLAAAAVWALVSRS